MNIQILFAKRLGNFIYQLQHAIHICIFYNYNLILPEHEFLNTNYLIFNKDIAITDEKITDKYNFFHRDKVENIDINCFNINKEEVNSFLKKIFIFKDIPPIGENDLVIHIRSGDIFTRLKNIYDKYIPPPLSYYTNILTQNNFDNIYLISEDNHNPCINKLLELYPKINFKLQDLEKDVRIILSTRNIITSVGTFIPQLLLISTNIQKIYYPSYREGNFSNFKEKYIEKHSIELSEYHSKINRWENTKEQYEMMLNF
jgi:hypothetical protein